MSDSELFEEKQAIGDARTAVEDLVTSFQDYQSRMEAKMRIQEDRLAMLDRKAGARPALGAAADVEAPHRKAMAAYLRAGDETGLRALDVKSITTGSAGDGGMPVDAHTALQIGAVLGETSTLRAVANVVQVEAATYDTLADVGTINTAWQSENGTPPESAGEAFERVSIPLHELAAMPRASQRVLDDSAFDVEQWLVNAIAQRFAEAENEAFVVGDGINQPTGFLHYPTAAFETAAWGEIGVVASGTAGGFDAVDPANSLLDLIYSLETKYRRRAVFVMNSNTVGTVRKMKDADGNFLWTQSLCQGEPSSLMGHPVVVNETMPPIGSGTTPIAFGDFGAGYTIAERPGLRILRDPYSAKPHVQFYASTRLGGAVTDFRAIRLMQLSDTV